MADEGGVDTTDVPQADNLDMVRRVVTIIANGAVEAAQIGTSLSITARHVRYCLHSARIVGWITFESPQLTLAGMKGSESLEATVPKVSALGLELLETEAGSEAERLVVAKSLLASDTLRRVGGDFLEAPVALDELAGRIKTVAGISIATAKRRARTLLAWRRLALGQEDEVLPTKSEAVTSDAGQDSSRATKEKLRLPVGQFAYLGNQLSLARVVMFAGRGFAGEANNLLGDQVPTLEQLSRAVWSLLFDEDFEEGTDLQDLVSSAARSKPKPLAKLLRNSFSIVPSSIPEHLAVWFRAPWRRVYTTAIDDLPEAAAEQFSLRRRPSLHSTASTLIDKVTLEKLAFILMNGSAADGTAQFNELASPDTGLMSVFDADYLAYPTIFVGSADDENELWKHVTRRGSKAGRGVRELRPKSLLVCPVLSRPRRALVNEFNVEWIQASPEQFSTVLDALARECAAGQAAIKLAAQEATDSAANIRPVADLLAGCSAKRTEYLLGDNPLWSDLKDNRAVLRECDATIHELAKELIAQRNNSAEAPILALTGTTGTGKTTALMRLAMRLSAEGSNVAWISHESEISSRTLSTFGKSSHGYSIVALDEAARFHRQSADNLIALADNRRVKLVIAAVHSSFWESMQLRLTAVNSRAFAMPMLEDSDIGAILDALERDHRLGVLKGKNRSFQEQVFREKAGRKLLVAMIEATSDQRFEEKLYSEWDALPERSKFFYSLVTVASDLGYSVSRAELLRGSEASRQADDLAIVDRLVASKLIMQDADRFRARHKLIASTLVKELLGANKDLTSVLVDLAYGVAFGLTPETIGRSRAGRFERDLLSYKKLFRMVGFEGAQRVYDGVEELLHWHYHYWLQRGSLEVAEGDVRLAEQYLNQARALAPNDDRVITEYAYMLLRKARAVSGRTVDELFREGVKLLKAQITRRGASDSYPYHVMGKQVLACIRKIRWPKEERVSALRDAHQDLLEGLRRHPSSQKLVMLESEVKRELLALQTGLSD